MNMFKTVLKIAQSQETTIGFSLVALLTAGGEQVFSAVVFKCPCSGWNFAYGTVFLLVPALALLFLGYILSNKTWKLFTGLCLRKSKCKFKTFCACGIVFVQITTTAMVAPVSWIAVALLNGNFFECAITGVNVTLFKKHLCDGRDPRCPAELHTFPCGSNVPQSQSVLATIRAESQVLGWLVITSIMVFYLTLNCVAKCYSPISSLELKFWKAYTKHEADLMEDYTIKHAKELADRNLKSFFELIPPKPLTTPHNRAWEKISSLFKFNTNDHYYSTLHRYVEKESDPENPRGSLIMGSVRSDGLPANPAVLDFVDAL